MMDVSSFQSDAVLNYMTEPILLVNDKDEVVFFNAVAARHYHLSQKPLAVGQVFTEIIRPAQKQSVDFILQLVKDTRNRQTIEAEYIDTLGRTVYFECIFTPIVADESRIDYICILSRDITAQKVFEKKTFQLLRDLSTLIETANAVIFGVDSRGYITEWNTECARVTQLPKYDVYAQKAERIIDPENQKDFVGFMERVLAGEAVSNYELTIKTKSQPITALLNATPKFNATGHVIGALFVGQDITELSNYRRSLEREVQDRTHKLEEALKKEKDLVEMKNRFVSIASHEFKLPLSSVSSSVRSLKRNENLSDKEKADLKSIETQVSHMKDLLDDILTLKKGDTDKLKPNYHPVDLISFLKLVSEEVRTGTHCTHAINAKFPVSDVYVNSDEKFLRNIFVNLLSNAIKFSPGKNEIGLWVDIVDEKIVVRVRDYGIGIEPTDIKRIFEPFNRGSNAGSIRGTGLGLSIVKKAVEALEGELAIESEPGNGTQISVSFQNNNIRN